jgi:hypothetical protein
MACDRAGVKHTGSCRSRTPARAEPVHGSVHELAAPGASAARCAIELDTVVARRLLLPGELGDSNPGAHEDLRPSVIEGHPLRAEAVGRQPQWVTCCCTLLLYEGPVTRRKISGEGL